MAKQINWQIGLLDDPFQTAPNVSIKNHQTLVVQTPIDLDDIYDLLEEVARYVELIFAMVGGIKTCCAKTNERLIQQDQKMDSLFSAISDLRRELLRGNRDIGR